MPVPRATLTAAIRERLSEALPQARVRAARFAGEGWGATAYRVPAPDGDWILRLPKPQSWWAMPDLEREVRLLPLIERQPFEVVVPREPGLLRDAEGGPIGALHRMVPGTPLAQAGAPRWAARARLCEQIGRFLSVLHATPAAAAKRHGAREVDLWSEHYVPTVNAAIQQLTARTRAWLEQRAADFEAAGGTKSAPRALIHADISGDHLLVGGDGRLSGVIDFADAFIADPALDFAGVLNHLGWRDLERVWAAYSGEVDQGAIDRTRFYIEIAPIHQVTAGAAGVGPEERRRGIRRLAARAGAARR
ncbi:MAG: aminoglycoside phosphotransferase family protein [Dehalococcoidia bacterium]